jgi:hypothetical protein
MNIRRIGLVSILVNIGLLSAAVFIDNSPKNSIRVEEQTASSPGAKPDGKAAAKTARPTSASASAAQGKQGWAIVESRDFKTYIANLRSVDCPEETIRDIIVAEVNKLYAGKMRELRGPEMERHYWKSDRQSQSKENQDFQKNYKAMLKEKSDLLVELLGVDPEKEERKQNGNVDYYERMYSFLPESKQEQTRTVQEKYEALRQAIYQRGEQDEQDQKELREITRKQMAEMGQFLTPTELESYELHSSQTASQLRYDLDGLEPSEAEFRTIYKVRKAHEEELAYNYDPDNKEAQKRREEAIKQSNKEIAALLPSDRAAEYERMQDYSYKELVRLVARQELPKETASTIYDSKKTAEEAAKTIRDNKSLTQQQKSEALKKIQSETETQIATSLGDKKMVEKYKRRGGWWLNNLGSSNAR